MTHTALEPGPDLKSCAWCGTLTTGRFQASACCASCALGTPKDRVTTWLRTVGRKVKR